MSDTVANGIEVKPSLETIRMAWIDQDMCTGDGLCEEILPELFGLGDDGLAYVKINGELQSDPGGADSLANIPDGKVNSALEAASECPGECIFLADPEGNTFQMRDLERFLV